MFGLYRQRHNRLVLGVLAGFAKRFGWETRALRLGFFLLCLFGKLGLLLALLYVGIAWVLPYEEDVYAQRYGTGPRKVKPAQKIQKGWFK